ncbi:hypothetical protein PCANC_24019 [Puccinia coronata f. sp. avenae]|uniref:Uncharacterized protein n=1 Tax=Puccinia coronata f. sp. avenae TaxID=200324 RepID=A0A2N5TU62_9BASI|nr:hypothetical protein PCANC_24019 [Puccinia coronata f. sp. avenae]
MLLTASLPIGNKDNLPKRHTAWPNLQPQNIEAACGLNPHQKHQAAGLGTTAGAPFSCPCTNTETKDGPGAELSPTPGRSYVAPLRPVAALGRYQAACARLSLGPACDDSGYRRITVAHPFRPGDPWRRRSSMGTGSGTVSQVAPLWRLYRDNSGGALFTSSASESKDVALPVYQCSAPPKQSSEILGETKFEPGSNTASTFNFSKALQDSCNAPSAQSSFN